MLYPTKLKLQYFNTLFATSKRQISNKNFRDLCLSWIDAINFDFFSVRHAHYLPLLLGQPVVSETASAQPFQKARFLAVGHSSNAESGPYKQMYMTSARVSSTTQGRFGRSF